MFKRSVRLPIDGQPLLDIFSLGRVGPSARFTPVQIEQIRRTVGRTPEVMVKVTGGGTNSGAVAAHISYISRKGDLAIETDEGARVANKDAQKALLNDWHLELSAGQYRAPRDGRSTARHTKLVHNIVLSMPSPTPPEKVLAAARNFARKNFGGRHRYAMVLHTGQRHPHVHMVVKAESEEGRRLHIDKAMLRTWREHFAQLMREQGVAANASPRVARGRNKRNISSAVYRSQQHGASHVIRDRVTAVAKQLSLTGFVEDPARGKLLETRASVLRAWRSIADILDHQGEVVLAGDVRQFARHLPPVQTDNEKLAERFAEFLRPKDREPKRLPEHLNVRTR